MAGEAPTRSRINVFNGTVIVLALLVEAAFVATYATSPRDQSIAVPLAFTLFPLLFLVSAFRFHQDGFSLGATFIAILFEVAIYLGWSNSPQLEEDRLLWTAAAFPLIFIAIIFLFNYLQKEA